MSRYLATLAARASGRVALLSPRPRTLYEGGGEDMAFEEPALPIARSAQAAPGPSEEAPSPARENMAPLPVTAAPTIAATIHQGPVMQVTQVLSPFADVQPAVHSRPVPPIPPAAANGERPAVQQPPAEAGHEFNLTHTPAHEPDRAAHQSVPPAAQPDLARSERTILREIVHHRETREPADTTPGPHDQAPAPRTIEPAPLPVARTLPRSAPVAPQPRQRPAAAPRSEPPVVIRIERIDVHAVPPPLAPPPARRAPAATAPSPGPSLAEFLSGKEPAR